MNTAGASLRGAAAGLGLLDAELRDLNGGYQALSSWGGTRVLLVFVQPGCRYSRALLQMLDSTATNPSPGRPTIILIGFGDLQPNRILAERYRIACPFLIQDNTELAGLLGVVGTPAGCLVAEDGKPAARPTYGAARILGHIGLKPAGSGVRAGWEFRATRYADAGHRLWRLLQTRESSPPPLSGRRSFGPREPYGARASERPLVTAVMATRDRPRFVRTALECYRLQTYDQRELLVIDDGTDFPVDQEAVESAGGRLIRVAEGTPPGAKLNLGITEGRGSLCQIWDDDDWYAPAFIDEMASAALEHIRITGEPALAYLTRHYWFDLAGWRIFDWQGGGQMGGTLMFRREDWEKHRFRETRLGYDTWFLVDQIASGVSPLALDRPQLYLYVRHAGLSGERTNTWRRAGRRDVDEDLRATAPTWIEPDAVLPEWAMGRYRDLWHESYTGSTAAHPTPVDKTVPRS
jgi:hypothetical protein